MFVLLLTYVRPVEEVDALMRKHMAWLNEHYDAGRFVVAARLASGDGDGSRHAVREACQRSQAEGLTFSRGALWPR